MNHNHQSPITNHRSSSGQSLFEYMMLTAVVVGALVAMVTFVRAAVAHMAKSGADTFGQGMLYKKKSP